jgi:hypothetical protein
MAFRPAPCSTLEARAAESFVTERSEARTGASSSLAVGVEVI